MLRNHGLRKGSYINHVVLPLSVKSGDPRFFRKPVVLRGENVAKEFLDHVMGLANEIRYFLVNKIKMEELTALQEEEFLRATKCHICGRIFRHRDKRIKDHDYLSGKYRGPAHNACNLQYRINPKDIKIPCIMHNLRS